MKKIKFEKWQLILLSVFYIVFGIISAAVPRENFLTFFNVLGLLIMVFGAFSILVWFLRREAHAAHSNQVAWGTLYIIAGILVWMRPQIIVSNYPMVFAGCVCIDSALRLQYGMDLQGMRVRGWQLIAASALLTIILALVILLADLQGSALVVLFTILLCLDGASNLAVLVYGRMLRKARSAVRSPARVEEEE